MMPGVDLPVNPPVKPMLAKPVKGGVPAASSVDGGLRYEPKWDGFRCIVFRDGDEVVLGSRNEKPLTRYFPEVVEAVLRELPERCVVDGELVAVVGDRLDFDTLSQRIHPADSRVQRLAAETPVSFVAFDLLALGDESLLDAPFSERRARLETALADASPPVHLTPLTTDEDVARRWFEQFEGAGLDGLVAKPAGIPYSPDKRLMLKVKHERTADVVVGGYRLHKTSTDADPLVGSLLLGIYRDDRLQHVGVAGAFSVARRRELVDELAPYVLTDGAEHPWVVAEDPEGGGGDRRPGGQPNRWNAKKDMSFVPLRPELVVEVAYDHMEGDRFRHTAQLRRWRHDREPVSCTYEQLDEPVGYDLAQVLGA
jgi:ATP-dependent DNA ligase